MLNAALVALVMGWMPSPPLVRDLASRTVVLTYHDMVPLRDAQALWFDCTPTELAQQLDWLSSQGASFISVDQLYRHLTTGAGLPEKAVLITFADNYRGFYDYALPILRKRKIPTVMFVHTDFVGSTQGRPKMTWEQLLELDREGLITIASQTKSHPADLRKMSRKQVMAEFLGSKNVLEERLGHRVRYLAYPNGKFDVEVSRAAALAGYDMAFTEEQTPAEVSPGIFEVARYVHTKYQTAWNDATR